MPSLVGPHFLQFQTPPPDWLAEVGHLSASFQSEWLHRTITGIRRLTPHEFKARAAPITLDILKKITSPDVTTVDELNLDTACKVT